MDSRAGVPSLTPPHPCATKGPLMDNPSVPRPDIDAILNPGSIAVVGASTHPAKQGHTYVSALREFGFQGHVYPINPKAEEVAGYTCYPSLKDVPGPVDYVISAVPAPLLPQVMEDARGKQVKGIHLFTARMAEMATEEGLALEAGIIRSAKELGARIIGPNCMGLYNPGHGISFRQNLPKQPGRVGFLSQSGGNTVEFVYRASLRGVFFSKAVSYGNAADLNECDLLEYFTHDPETSIIACYIEGIRGGPRFFEVLSKAASVKPVVLLKGGRGKAGTRAVASHTASLAGSTQIWRSAVTQAGAIWAETIEEMTDIAVALRFMDKPRGPRVGIICGGGGNTVHSADICEAAGLTVEPLPESARSGFKNHLPDTWFHTNNPFDLSGIMSSDDHGMTMPLAVRLMAESGAFDLILIDPDIDFHFDHPLARGRVFRLMEILTKLPKEIKIPVAMIIRPGDALEEWRWRAVTELQQMAWQAGVPVYNSMPRAAACITKVLASPGH